MRSRVLAAVLLASGCSAPALANFSVGDHEGSSTGESSGTSSGTSSTGGGESSGGESSGGESSSSSSGSGGMTMSTTAPEESSTGGSSSSSGPESTGTSGAEPFCGDGVVAGEEECDDGNFNWDDGCNQVCGRDRIVFVTDELFQPFQLGGADSADDICKQAAGLAALPHWESYTAWLSDSTTDAIDRVHLGRGRYVRPDGVEVAADFMKLMLGPLQQPISVTEYGEQVLGSAWTGTQADGTLTPGLSHCHDWTINGPADFTTNGAVLATDSRWTQRDNPEPCGDEARLYCFEGK